jgi:hypothetical protein
MTPPHSGVSKKFWTFQKKFVAIFGTIAIFLTVMFGMVQAKTLLENTLYEKIDKRAMIVCVKTIDSCFTQQKEFNDSLLSEIREIRMEQIRTSYINREYVSPAIMAKARSNFFKDSLQWEKRKN